MRLFYRTYDRQWNRTGWSDTPQYPGQIAGCKDFPLACACGRSFDRVVRPDPRDNEQRYQASCSAGHWTLEQPIRDLIRAAL